jgi:hypothetical protein
MAQEPHQQEAPAAPAARGVTLVITNLTKILGLIVAVNEILIRPSIRDSALAVAAAMMFGAQTVENVLLGAIDRMMHGQ